MQIKAPVWGPEESPLTQSQAHTSWAEFEKGDQSEIGPGTLGVSVYSTLHHPSEQTVYVDLSTQLCEMELP